MFGLKSKKQKKRVYADHAAATPTDPSVVSAMAPYWSDVFANAGGVHQEGMRAREAVDEARKLCASELGAKASEIIFTSGGTEANNLAIFGAVEAALAEGKKYEDLHFVTLAIEHSSVLECFRELEKRGAQVTHVAVGGDGIVRVGDVIDAITKNTLLVSVMHANSEIGTIQPLREIGLGIAEYRSSWGGGAPYFHTDAAQAPEYLSCHTDTLGVDYLTADGMKVYGPKGVGLLFRKSGTPLRSIMYGGRQEVGLRPGTPPTALIVGFAHALALARKRREKECVRLSQLRDMFIENVLACVPHARVNGHRTARLPNNANISFPGHDAEYFVLQLDQHGVATATRSACHVGEEGESHVIHALGVSEKIAESAVRFTFGRSTTEKDITFVVDAIKKITRK